MIAAVNVPFYVDVIHDHARQASAFNLLCNNFASITPKHRFFLLNHLFCEKNIQLMQLSVQELIWGNSGTFWKLFRNELELKLIE